MTEIKQPKIRFKGHINDWEQRKLGDLGNFKNGMNFDKNAMGNGYPFVNLQDVFEKPIVKKEELGLAEATPNQLKDYNLLEGDVLFVRSSVKREGVGLTAIIPEDFINTTYSGFIIRFRSTEELSKEYKQFVFSTPNLRNQILIRSTSGANTNINQDNLKLLTIPIPNIEEQKKIGEFFKTLDNTINLHQQKLEVTKQFKQTMLKKMFPKNGETTPEIRFKGFTEDWEECKLGDVIEEYSELQAQSIEYPLVSFTSENGVTPKTERYNREQLVVGEASSKKYKKTEYNDIVYNPANLKFGAIARNTYGKSVFSPIYVTFKVISNNVSPEFIESIVTRKDFINYSLKFEEGTVYERKSVKPKDFLNINCRIPSSKEQYMVGKYFEELDIQIKYLEQKLESYKEFKKSMLQKMFI